MILGASRPAGAVSLSAFVAVAVLATALAVSSNSSLLARGLAGGVVAHPNRGTSSSEAPTPIQATLPVARNQAESDFEPCQGVGTPPPQDRGETGPWAMRLMIAYSDDGLTWTRANRVLSDQADVPDAIVDDDGTLRVYYVTWCPTPVPNRTVVALSGDGGQTWRYRRVTINGIGAQQPSAVDPDVIRLPDGRWRLFFTSAPGGGPGEPRSYSAISDDGITFQVEAGARLTVDGRSVVDPSVVRVGDTWHLFAGGRTDRPGANWHAVSADGLDFTRVDELVADRIIIANGIQVPNGSRIYGFRHTGGRESRAFDVRSIFTAEGTTWTVEPGARLTLDTAAGLESVLVKDPAVTRLRDGRYVLIYVTVIPGYEVGRR
ncbi:MAG: exo-alpha-sialidase [Chloroflexi bacterium]|nr:exo-alpha-sialidase [Chloroflexota bacterium]